MLALHTPAAHTPSLFVGVSADHKREPQQHITKALTTPLLFSLFVGMIPVAYGAEIAEAPGQPERTTEADFPMPSHPDAWRELSVTAPMDSGIPTTQIEVIAIDPDGDPTKTRVLDRESISLGDTYRITVAGNRENDNLVLRLSTSAPALVESRATEEATESNGESAIRTLKSRQVAGKTRWCYCTDYMAAVFKLTGYPNASLWNDGFLQSRGFKQASEPKSGYITVIEGGAFGMDARGHVTVTDKKESLKKEWKLTLQGANQGGATFTDSGCNNVSKMKVVVPKNSTRISYWKR